MSEKKFEVSKKYKLKNSCDKNIYTCDYAGKTGKAFLSYEDKHGKVVETWASDIQWWEEAREPRVIYINEWRSSKDNSTSLGAQYESEEEAKQMRLGEGYVATRKFIEVLD